MSNATSSLNQDIISNVISQTKLESNSESNENFEMIEIGTGSGTQTLLGSDDVSYALQSKNIHPDNTISVKTVFPYKVTEDGEMINSFEYASLRASSNETTKFVDVTVTVVASYIYVRRFR